MYPCRGAFAGPVGNLIMMSHVRLLCPDPVGAGGDGGLSFRVIDHPHPRGYDRRPSPGSPSPEIMTAPTFSLRFTRLALCIVFLSDGRAATVTKNDTTSLLPNASNWSAAPGATDIGSFNGTPPSTVRRGGWKLNGDKLYNLDTDPTEKHNLAKRQTAIAAELTREMEAFRQDLGIKQKIKAK